MKKNDVKIGTVVSVGINGEGILKEEGIVTFVPFALTGEKIRYKVLKVTSKIAYGKLLEVLTPAENRVRPKCPVFTKCGGCQFQHIKYAQQLKFKEDNVANCFKKIAGLDVKVLPTVKGENEFYYRNKLQLPVQDAGDKTVIGFYAENSHRVIPIEDCVINAIWTKDIIKSFNEYIREYGIKGYNEKTCSGELREITVKEIKGNLIITVVTATSILRERQGLINILTKNLKYEFSLFHNVNNSTSNVIYGDKFELVYGKKDYSAEMLGVKYKIGVQSFMQVNTSVCAKLYSSVIASIEPDEQTTVIDAYSGAGLMTALLAKKAKKAIGIEIIPEAVSIANDLAIKNGLQDKMANYLGKCEEIMPDIIQKERANNQQIAIVLDPPRKGCELSVVNAVKDSGADKIVYVSCMPSTLARDVGLICGSLKIENGQIVKVGEGQPLQYEVSCCRTFDMFAQTKHIETLCVLTRAKKI